MKTLLLLRHAKSSWGDPGLPDHERPLNERGQRDAPRMGRLLAQEGLLPDLMLVSSATRARATAQAVAEASGYAGESRTLPTLYLATPAGLLAELRGLPDTVERVLVVGHNPGLEQLVGWLTRDPQAMPTAALAHISLPIERWAALDNGTQGTLARLWRPKLLAE